MCLRRQSPVVSHVVPATRAAHGPYTWLIIQAVKVMRGIGIRHFVLHLDGKGLVLANTRFLVYDFAGKDGTLQRLF